MSLKAKTEKEKNTLSTPPPQINLKPGDSGDDVKKLQDYLVSQGVMTQEQVNTGYGTYGPQTKNAVAELQKKLGINVGTDAGFYGPKTISSLGGGQSDGYYSVNGTVYQKNGNNFSTVTDPTTLKSIQGQIKESSYSKLFGTGISGNVTDEENQFFNSPEFKSLSEDKQSAIRSVFDVVQTNDEQKKGLLQKAIAKATENADPIFKQTLKLSLDALDRGFASVDNDLVYKEEQLSKRLAELKTDTEFAKGNLTLDQQVELKQLQDNYKNTLETTRQDLASSGFTDSSRRAKAESILDTTKGNLVESSNRRFAEKNRALDTTLSRTGEDTQAEIERLRQVASESKTDLGRRTEAVVGSGNLPGRTGYDALGNVIGSAEQDRQKDIDTAALDYYQLGFVT